MALLIDARNVNDAFDRAKALIRDVGFRIETRNGLAYRAPVPVITSYERPFERVLFDPVRDANPFFHLFESLWILAGREDAAFLTYLNKRMAEYAEADGVYHGSYGARLRPQLGSDQLDWAVQLLRHNPADRRVVLSIWNAGQDLGVNKKDIPCNVTVKVDVVMDHLQLTVFNRSNDILWGAYGANAVQFSMLQEYLAGRIGMGVGPLHQVSTDWHWYGELPALGDAPAFDPYAAQLVTASPLFSPAEAENAFDEDLDEFFTAWAIGDFWLERTSWQTTWFTTVAAPLWRALVAFKHTYPGGAPKTRTPDAALEFVRQCAAADWRQAADAWIRRRI